VESNRTSITKRFASKHLLLALHTSRLSALKEKKKLSSTSYSAFPTKPSPTNAFSLSAL
jgi:hypothetical protein